MNEPRLALSSAAFRCGAGACGLIAAALSAIALAGRLLRLDALAGLPSSLLAIKAATAVSFTLLGISLFLATLGTASSPRSALVVGVSRRVLAGAVALSGAATLLLYALGLGFVISRLLAWDSRAFNGLLAQPFAPNSALTFTLLGLAFALAPGRGRLRALVGGLDLAALALVGLSALALAYSLRPSWGVAPSALMQPRTAATFALLGLGGLALDPERGLIAQLRALSIEGSIARRLLPAVFFVPIIDGFFQVYGFRRGFYEPFYGLVFSIVFDILILVALVAWSSRSVGRADRDARLAEDWAAAVQRESERTMRLFVENSPASIAMFDRDMRYLLASRRWLESYHLESRDLTGLSHYDVFPEIGEDWKAVHRRCLAGAVESRDEDPFPRADGSLDWVRWEVRPWFVSEGEIGGIIILSELITERKKVELAARASEERYKSLFENMVEGFAFCRMEFDGDRPVDWTYLDVNPAFERLTGLVGVAGRNVTEAIPGIRVTDPALFEIYGRVASGVRPSASRWTSAPSTCGSPFPCIPPRRATSSRCST